MLDAAERPRSGAGVPSVRADIESMVSNTVELTRAEQQAIDAFAERELPHLAAALKDLPWAGGLQRRESLAAVVEAQRAAKGALTMKTFDAVLKWGFGRGSNLSEARIRSATRDAFALLGSGDQAGAVKRLQELPGVGVSRATKVLALADQMNLGIYDSHAAAALRPIANG